MAQVLVGTQLVTLAEAMTWVRGQHGLSTGRLVLSQER
jgi:hypothetical protein